MAFQSVPGVAQIEFHHLSNTVPWEHTLYAYRPLGYTQGDLEDLLEAMVTWSSTGIIEYLSNEATFVGVTVRGLENQNDFVLTETLTTPVAGLVNSPPLPVNACACIKIASVYTGKNARGRNYLSSVPENQAGSRSLNSAWMLNVATRFNTVKAEMVAAGWTWVIVSREVNKIVLPVGVPWNVDKAYFATTRVASRRGRLNNE